MGNCSECGKKIGFLGGYLHPIRGEKYLVCSDCFNKIDKSIGFYQKCIVEGRKNHKKECYFWDSKNKRCKNEKFFKNLNKKRESKT